MILAAWEEEISVETSLREKEIISGAVIGYFYDSATNRQKRQKC